jgi:hypothetical protein
MAAFANKASPEAWLTLECLIQKGSIGTNSMAQNNMAKDPR